MAHPVTQERIDKFWQDRRLLPYDDVVIAERMKKDRSNYSKSVNEGPITNGFLEKFYTAFEEELKKLRAAAPSGPLPVYTSPGEYPKEIMEDLRNNISALREDLHRLIQSLQNIAQSIQAIAQSNLTLAQSNQMLAQNNQKLLEVHVSILPQLAKPDKAA